SVKEQLRRIPRRGIGYGILRYLAADSGLAAASEPSMVFNYLGQFDQVLAGSTLFRFAPEASGPWHSPLQRRRQAIEVNGMVLDGRLQFRWTVSGELAAEGIARLADEFRSALHELIAHCTAVLERIVATPSEIVDTCALSPIQTLFLS